MFRLINSETVPLTPELAEKFRHPSPLTNGAALR